MKNKFIMNRSTLRKLLKNPIIDGIKIKEGYIKTILTNTSDRNYYKNISYILDINAQERTYKIYYTDEKLERNFSL